MIVVSAASEITFYFFHDLQSLVTPGFIIYVQNNAGLIRDESMNNTLL